MLERYSNEIRRVTGVIDAHLAKHNTDYLVGDRVTYADLMFLPYIKSLATVIAPEIDLRPWGKHNAWVDRMSARPAVAKVLSAWTEESDAAMEKMRAQQAASSTK